MDFLNKQNITYIIIFLFIVLSLMQLYKMNGSDDSGDINESFITIDEPQTFGPNANAIIPSTDAIQFGALGTSTVANNLTTLLNKSGSGISLDSSNSLIVPGIVSSSRSTNEGGAISIRNPSKTSDKKSADNWVLYNMKEGPPNSYGNGLHFYKYNGEGPIINDNNPNPNPNPNHCSFYDNGSTVFRGGVTIDNLKCLDHFKCQNNALQLIGGGGLPCLLAMSNRDKVDDDQISQWVWFIGDKNQRWPPTSTNPASRYPNALMLYAYGSNSAINHAHVFFNDDNTTKFNGDVTVPTLNATQINCLNGGIYGRGIELSLETNEGPAITFKNPLKKNVSGLVDSWIIYNMTDIGPARWKYRSGLYFWKYGLNLSYANGNAGQLILYDNGESEFNGNLNVRGNLIISGDMFMNSTKFFAADGMKLLNLGSINCVTVSASDIYGTNFLAGGVRFNSDRRLKENIKNISENDKNKVLQLVPKTYNFIDDEKKSKRYGLIAQEVEELYPELVSTNDKGIKSMNYIELIPLLLEQIKELKKSIPNPDTVNTNIVNTDVLNIGGVTLTANELLKLKQLLNQ